MRSRFITALAATVASLAPAPNFAQAADTPPSAFAPAPQSDQPDVKKAPAIRGARFTSQQTGSAGGGQLVVPLAARVAPTATNQPIDNAPNK